MQSCSRIKGDNGRLVLDEQRGIWKKYFEDTGTGLSLDGVRREITSKENRLGKLRLRLKFGSLRMERLQVRMRSHRDDKRWRWQCGRLDLETVKYSFETVVVPEDCRSSAIVPLHKDK